MHYLGELGGWPDARTAQQRIRDDNIKCLFKLLSRKREISRSELSRISGLSPTTVSALVDELLRENLAVEVGYARAQQSGRKPINLLVNASGRQFPVFCLDRDGLHYSLYNLAMELMESIFVPARLVSQTGSDMDPERLGDRWIEEMLAVLGRRSRYFSAEEAQVVCFSYTGLYLAEKDSFFVGSLRACLKRESLLQIERKLGLPVFIGSVAQSMAYDQMRYLEAVGESVNDLIYLVVGGDVGTGIVENGSIRSSRESFPGEVGHVSIDYRGRSCACGARGCLEQYVNVDALEHRVRQMVDFYGCNRLPKGEKLSIEMIGAAYDSGEKAIVDCLNDVASQLYTGIYSTMRITGIRRFFLGGGIERLGAGFLKTLQGLAANTGSKVRQIMIEYGHIAPEKVQSGIVQYYLDKVFEIGKRHAY